MSIRAVKSMFSDSWSIEQEFACINGLSAWFQIAEVPEADEQSMGYTDGHFGTAEDRANRIVEALNK